MGDEFWNDCYLKGNTGWDRGEIHPALLRWIEMGLLNPCSIVVPGCGRGHEVVELAKRGFNVTAIDIADEPVGHLRKQLAGFESDAQVVQKNIFDFQPTEPVDAVYEQTCLCAIHPDMRQKYEQTIASWLKPAGEFFVLFAQKSENLDGGPPYHCDLTDMKLIFPESRWLWQLQDDPEQFPHPTGKLSETAFVLMRRQ